jgi:hypothetical protein
VTAAVAANAPVVSSEEERRDEIKRTREFDRAAGGQRFATERQRQVFTLFSKALDDTDAFQRLFALLHGNNEGVGNDIAAVAVQCCSREETYNPFYGLVLRRLLSTRKHRFHVVLQFALWDVLKKIRIADTPDLPAYVNLACLISFLIREGHFSIAVFRGLDLDLGFSGCLSLFTRILFLRMMLDLSLQQLAEFFFGQKRGKDDDADAFGGASLLTKEVRVALQKFFATYFVDDVAAGRWMPALLDVVAGNTINQETLAILVEELPRRISAVKNALKQGNL